MDRIHNFTNGTLTKSDQLFQFQKSLRSDWPIDSHRVSSHDDNPDPIWLVQNWSQIGPSRYQGIRLFRESWYPGWSRNFRRIVNVKYPGPKLRKVKCARKNGRNQRLTDRRGTYKSMDIFEEVGYDSFSHLFVMGPSELSDLKRLTKMNPGHFARL